MKLIRVIQSKIVKKDNKYQVQSEKGRNLGTYNTKEEAEKRLKQVEMFKHMKKKSSEFTVESIEKLYEEAYDVEEELDYDTIYRTLIMEDGTEHKLEIVLDFDLDGLIPESKGTHSPLALTPEEYYGNDDYFEDFSLNKVVVTKIDGESTHIEMPLDSKFSKDIFEYYKEHFQTSEDYQYNPFED